MSDIDQMARELGVNVQTSRPPLIDYEQAKAAFNLRREQDASARANVCATCIFMRTCVMCNPHMTRYAHELRECSKIRTYLASIGVKCEHT